MVINPTFYLVQVLMTKTKRTRSVRRGSLAGGRTDLQDKSTVAVDKTESNMGVVLALPAPSVTRAEDGSIPRGVETIGTRWKRRAVSAVRDFPPGCGPAWLRDQSLTTSKGALPREGLENDQGSDEEEPEEDTSDTPDVDDLGMNNDSCAFDFVLLWEIRSTKARGGDVRVEEEGVYVDA
ncbi:hypothetical protein L1987_48468 [Smallanthus sonchifolius]|uniref:Uncharacterized protein n=1 Tax=Smallanthus sonchifolius TaxID=185202 RepID=A0ACB9FS07_9ASTR|nr:hypothetical protein L1987_48468 [Smallanthus sonchifolius]